MKEGTELVIFGHFSQDQWCMLDLYAPN